MRRETRILLATLVLAGAWAGAPHVPSALERVEWFRIQDLQVRGLRYVPRDTVVARLSLDARASVWVDLGELEGRVSSHPLVRSVSVERRLPGTLIVQVQERIPVALVATPVLEPVDEEGLILPLDPTVLRLDLPILEGAVDPAPGARFVPEPLRRLAREVSRLQRADTAFLRRVSEVAWLDDAGGQTILARWGEPRVEFLLRAGTPAHRLREGFAALGDAMLRVEAGSPRQVDLRYADQVVVRRTEAAPQVASLIDGMEDAR